MRTEKFDWKQIACPICGKKFIPAPEHVYRRTVKGKMRYLCIASKNGWVLRAMKERGISLDDETRGEPSFDLDSFFKLAVERGKKEAKHV